MSIARQLPEKKQPWTTPGSSVTEARPEQGVTVEVASRANLPSEFGEFAIYVFHNNRDDKEHLAMVHGDVFGANDVATRLHSECLTGDVMASLRCDCRAQLEKALREIGRLPRGIVLYMRQEGRGIGLTNKIRAYALQEAGLDTVEANLALGFKDDERTYDVAAAMLGVLGVASIGLMTNNPDKVRKLEQAGVSIRERIAHSVAPNAHNQNYLATKAKKSGHIFSAEGLELPKKWGIK
jgi:GTP cyclohydrolase II